MRYQVQFRAVLWIPAVSRAKSMAVAKEVLIRPFICFTFMINKKTVANSDAVIIKKVITDMTYIN